jgi:hypothetical protein
VPEKKPSVQSQSVCSGRFYIITDGNETPVAQAVITQLMIELSRLQVQIEAFVSI